MTTAPPDALIGREIEPAGEGGHLVEDGEGMASIAALHGHFWERCWNDPANGALRAARLDPEVLLPGDRVTIQPIRLKDVDVATGARHRFRRRGVPSLFRARLLRHGEPRAGLAYTVEVEGAPPRSGTVDADGWMQCWIPPATAQVRLRLGEREAYTFRVGRLFPSADARGMRQRLSNLGYLAKDAPDDLDLLRAALRTFQIANDLPGTGESDDETRRILERVHGA